MSMPPEDHPPTEQAPKKSKRLSRLRRRKKKKQPKRGLVGFFLRGLITLAPVLLTLVVFGLAYQMVDRYITGPINSSIYWSLEGNSLGWRALERFDIDPLDTRYFDTSNLPVHLQEEALSANQSYSSEPFQRALELHRVNHNDFFKDLEALCIQEERLRGDVQAVVHPIIGVLLSLLLVLWLGWLVGGFLGRRVVNGLDQMMHVIPVVKSVYPYTKQIVEFFFSEKDIEFDTVVGVPYPSKGIWSLAFVTGSSLKTLREETGERLVSVFIPSSPMPMTGYTVFFPFDALIPVPISVDEALRITMTGGVLVPPHEAVDDPMMEEFDQGPPEDGEETAEDADKD
ncbi:MAG: putative membrane protein [Planctomycetota bacterium]|jgi:uncharacterized membrane protein